MQTYDITAPANAPFVVHAAGKYIKYLSGNNGGGDVSLIMTPGSNPGNKVTLVPGQAYRVADEVKTPDSWTVTNAVGGATILGKVVVGNGKLDDNSIAGTVQVVDGGKTRSLSGSAFIGSAYQGAVASQYAAVSINNLAGSGKRLVIEAYNFATLGGATSGAAAGIAKLLLGAIPAGLTAAGVMSSKLAGGSVSAAAQLMQGTSAALQTGTQLNFIVLNPALPTFQARLNEPIIIPPGYACIAQCGTLNYDFGCDFEWYEEPNV